MFDTTVLGDTTGHEQHVVRLLNVVMGFSGHDHQASGGTAGREEEEGDQEVHQRGDPHPGQREGAVAS